MTRFYKIVATALACIWAANGFAQDRTIWASKLGDFGTAALGDSGSQLPIDAKSVGACDPKLKRACEFIDRAGVTYKVAGGIVVSKSIHQIHVNPKRALPFGLDARDGISETVRKLSENRMFPDLDMTVGQPEDGGDVDLLSFGWAEWRSVFPQDCFSGRRCAGRICGCHGQIGVLR